MTQRKFLLRFSILTALIVICAFSRIILPIPNFSPLGAIGLFGAAYFTKKWQAFSIPIIATWLSDLLLNNLIYGEYFSEFVWFYPGFYWQYGSYMLITLVGVIIFRKINLQRIIGGAFASTIIFYLISNFGVWASGLMYPLTANGLITCYIAGIPYINGTLLGDLFYSGIMFGGFALLQNSIPSLKLNFIEQKY